FLQNVFFGVGGAVFSCVGDWTSAKQRGLLCLTVSILIMNIVNLIILEIGEWRYLTPESVKDSMSREGLETLILYARYTTSISTLVAIIGAFFDSQITFCCMLRVDKTQQNAEPDNNSDVDYIMPRYECLEKLTEPSVYRSRLNTALSASIQEAIASSDRPPRSLSPRPPPAAEPVQYASLMEELQKTIGNRLSKHVESPEER
ncbi:PREDICTED: uncharacterized protein LOC107172240, partial [Diuraphis noxia]|uniref:uncharacterized protein LOC107172240 n=1 Tax=Diuraphis noxia TaxID=143948 RepID=UPI0007637E5A